MNCLNYVEGNSEYNCARPVFLEEVLLHLEERYKNSNTLSPSQYPGTSGQKVWDYCKKLCNLKKRKINIARRYINQTIQENFKGYENQVQSMIFLCKIIDFKYLKFKSWKLIFPGYQKYFKTSNVRRHYETLHSIISDISLMI